MPKAPPAMVAVVFGLFLTSTPARAEDFPQPYMSGGIFAEWREPGSGQTDQVPAPVFSAGVKLSPGVSIEASFYFPAEQAFEWRFSYSSGIGDERASLQDTLGIAYLRFRSGCRWRFCVEPLVGAGIDFRRAETIALTSCGTIAFPRPCTPVERPVAVRSDRKSLVVSGGVDLSVRVAPHLYVVPAARLHAVAHERFLFPYPGVDFRGPLGGSTWVPGFGITAMLK